MHQAALYFPQAARSRRAVSAVVAIVCLAALAGDAVPETGREESDSEKWNSGVDDYRAGDMTNALAKLKPLVVSRTHGARAAELAGAIEFAETAKRGGEGVEKPLASLESAAVDLQHALRANPKDPRLNRNFTRAVDRLPELREQAHVEKVMKDLGQQDPGALLGAGVRDSRALMKDFPAALTNEASRTVAMCDAMAKRAGKLCDTWIAVKAGVAQSVTNEQQAMTIMAQVEEARSATESAATALSDIDPEAQEHLGKAEAALTRFWKMAILPPEACEESMLAQTNELLRTENAYGRNWQSEALDFTRAFRAKFPMWAQAYEQQAQADTNKPPFTKEAQAEISALSTEVEKMQMELAKAEDVSARQERKGGGEAAERVAVQFEVLKKLARIKELLPKDGGGGGGQNQQNQDQSSAQNKDQNRQQEDDGGKDRQDDRRQDQDKNEDGRQSGEDDKKNEEQSAAEERDKKDDGQIEDMLRRAQERSDQHEADKKSRMNKAPLPSNERDW